jgi:hypothetical protein
MEVLWQSESKRKGARALEHMGRTGRTDGRMARTRIFLHVITYVASRIGPHRTEGCLAVLFRIAGENFFLSFFFLFFSFSFFFFFARPVRIDDSLVNCLSE